MKWSGPNLPPGVSATAKRLSDGTIRWHFYHKATRTKLEGEPGTAAFERQAQRASRAPAPVIVKRETLADLCDLFEKSPEHAKCTPKSRIAREAIFKQLRQRWGEYEMRHLAVRQFRGEIFDWRDEFSAKPAMADKNVSTLQRLISWGYDRGKIEYDHSKKIPRLAEKRPREGCGISPEQEAKLLETGKPDEIRLYLFARMTGIRKSDLCRVSWSNLDDDGWIEWLHSKTAHTTKATSFYPTFALPALKNLIDEMPRRNSTDRILTIDAGIPWTVSNINCRWYLWLERAGLEDANIHFHDIRRQCVQDLLDADCTNAQSASISGHSIAEHGDGSFGVYTKRSRELALAAYRKLAAYQSPDVPGENVQWIRRK